VSKLRRLNRPPADKILAAQESFVSLEEVNPATKIARVPPGDDTVHTFQFHKYVCTVLKNNPRSLCLYRGVSVAP
jgi:hypothetical protein